MLNLGIGKQLFAKFRLTGCVNVIARIRFRCTEEEIVREDTKRKDLVSPCRHVRVRFTFKENEIISNVISCR